MTAWLAGAASFRDFMSGRRTPPPILAGVTTAGRAPKVRRPADFRSGGRRAHGRGIDFPRGRGALLRLDVGFRPSGSMDRGLRPRSAEPPDCSGTVDRAPGLQPGGSYATLVQSHESQGWHVRSKRRAGWKPAFPALRWKESMIPGFRCDPVRPSRRSREDCRWTMDVACMCWERRHPAGSSSVGKPLPGPTGNSKP